MILARTLSLIFILIFLSGCMSNFVRPTNDALIVGKSTSTNVTQLAGKPFVVNEKVKMNGEEVNTYDYIYLEGAKFWGLIIPTRTLTYTFFKDIIVGEEFNSSFPDESTEFDGNKVTSIIKGKSTKADIIALMGKPTGKLLYPKIKNKDESGIVYAYTVSRHAPFHAPTIRYLLTITLDDKDLVTSVSYLIDNEEQVKS